MEGFKKASFLDEILPGGWRFYPKPKGLELAFLNTCNIDLLSFFSFLFWPILVYLWYVDFSGSDTTGFGKGYKIPVRILYAFLGFGFMCALISE